MRVHYATLRIGGYAEDRNGDPIWKEFEVEVEAHVESDESFKKVIDEHDWAQELQLVEIQFVHYEHIDSLEGWKNEADAISGQTISTKEIYTEPDYED